MSAITTIRIDHDALPNQFDRSRPDAVAAAIEAALREDAITAEASDVISHIKLNCPPRSWPLPAPFWLTCSLSNAAECHHKALILL